MDNTAHEDQPFLTGSRSISIALVFVCDDAVWFVVESEANQISEERALQKVLPVSALDNAGAGAQSVELEP